MTLLNFMKTSGCNYFDSLPLFILQALLEAIVPAVVVRMTVPGMVYVLT